MGPVGFGLRLLFAMALVLVTYNPTGTSFFHWVQDPIQAMSLKVLAGLALVAAYAICLRATFNSIGLVGMGLVAALLGALGWVAYDIGLLSVEDVGLLQWLVLVGAGLILGIGLSWGHIRRRLSGQFTVDEPNNE